MLEVGFRELKDSAKDLRNKQAVRRPYFLGASIPVPNGRMARATLVCDQDADILITGINGTVTAPADVYGRRLPYDGALWPLFQSGGSGFSGYAERGLKVRVFASSDKEDTLSDPVNFMEVKNFLQPGYRVGGFARPYPFTHYLQRNAKLTFEFLNLDTTAPAFEAPIFHFVSLTLTCRKYDPFTK